ncbi:hypothetical protein RMATCC62417_15038 [Rhizopus microsporus]|nr:hypothetical protein RMATCC62417_15038 [Rhizopus microsporus]
MDFIDLEDPDFQNPIVVSVPSRNKRALQEEEEEEEEKNIKEQLNCTLCECAWTTQGPHRIVQLSCGDVFGKSCIDTYVKAFSSCPLCGIMVNKRDPRVIWPTKVLPEDEKMIKKLKEEIRSFKQVLDDCVQETSIVQFQLQQCRNELAKIKAEEALELKAMSAMAPMESPITGPKEFKLCRTFSLESSEKYRVLTVLPSYHTIVVSVEKKQSCGYGLRKINLFDTEISEYIDLHSNWIKDIKSSSERYLTLSTSLDKTLKLTSLSNNVTVQTYSLDAPGWSCAFDEYDDNLLYCGLANNTLMVYDIRNTKSPLHKLKDSNLSALAPIHSLNIGRLNDSRTTVLCSNLKQSYVWTFESDHSVRFNPIVPNADFKPFHTYYKNGKLLTSLRSKEMTQYIVGSNSEDSEFCFDTDIDWIHTNKYKQMVLTRNCFFERDGELLICFNENDEIKCRNKASEVQTLKLNGTVYAVQHCVADTEELLIGLSENQVSIYKYMAPVYPNHAREAWNYIRVAICNLSNPALLDKLDFLLGIEVNKSISSLVGYTLADDGVNPSPHIRLSIVNIILFLVFGSPSIASLDDKLYQRIELTLLKYSELEKVLDGQKSQWPFSSTATCTDKNLDVFYRTYFQPLIQYLVQSAREVEQDNMVKRMDNTNRLHRFNSDSISSIIGEFFMISCNSMFSMTVWIYAILCYYPDVQRNLSRELNRFIMLNGRQPTFSDRSRLPCYVSFQDQCFRYYAISMTNTTQKSSKDTINKNHAFDEYSNPSQRAYGLGWHFSSTASALFKSNVHLNSSPHNGRDSALGWYTHFNPVIELMEKHMFNTTVKTLARCTIKPALSHRGNKLYPSLDSYNEMEGIKIPLDIKIRLVEHQYFSEL